MGKLVFLGGTCGNNNWRNGFVDRMVARGCRRGWFYDPVVADWNDEARRREDQVKKSADYLFFYLGDPMELGNSQSAYSMVEATMAQYDTARVVAVFDHTSLSAKHAVTASKKAYTDLSGRFPYAPIFEGLAETEDWLVSRLLG
ncbi:MAG: nucleoside 2-deoxyribosyltransferase domain-containing protein [Candidatus Woesebacteria bacterium]|jgi:hypothetical protein